MLILRFLANLVAPLRLHCPGCDREVVPSSWDTCPCCASELGHLMINRNGYRTANAVYRTLSDNGRRSVPVMALRFTGVLVASVGMGVLLALAAESLGLGGPTIADLVATRPIIHQAKR